MRTTSVAVNGHGGSGQPVAAAVLPPPHIGQTALWEELTTVQEDEACRAHRLYNEAIITSETLDAIRALAGKASGAALSLQITDSTVDRRQDSLGESASARRGAQP
ncbi:glyceraldehyde-3-phosphate dehydrogenase [Kocuria rosea]|uniref:hypothetical protein n=1 Tax=Kocuria rosea TaxID=1275 RepID=UPI000E014390|nr:hypothetical protein [Kocuria rosea]STX03525.1 glyceraldehyde-3-phosphate dehydrogenase [Kocuria rosea]